MTDMDVMLRRMDLAYTKRWVTGPMQRESNVAEHTYRMTVIAMYLYSQVRVSLSAGDDLELLHYCISHDSEESITGDIPGPTKPNQFPTLTHHYHIIGKVADAIETGTWWVLWGNRAAWSNHPSNCAPARDIRKIEHYAPQIPGLMDAAKAVWRSITGNFMEDDYANSRPAPNLNREG